MPLTARQLALLAEIHSQAPQSPDGVDATRFRAAHDDDLDELDALESQKYLERRDNRYYGLRLLALVELKPSNVQANKDAHLCEHLFNVLRSSYKRNADAQIPLADLAKTADLPLPLVRSGLLYLRQVALFGGTTDLNAPDAYVSPSEQIIRIKTFDTLIDRLRRWSEPTPPPPGSREKQQKFGIIDSPTLLAPDLAQPCGIFGTALLYLDLDDFKVLNNDLTETVVDQLVLPLLHEILKACVDHIGHAYGEGGDEFVILLPNFSEAMALAFAEELRIRIERTRFKDRANHVRLTASIGVAHVSHGEDYSTLKERANQAKKFAKVNGKNAVAVWKAQECQLTNRDANAELAAPRPGAGEELGAQKDDRGLLDFQNDLEESFEVISNVVGEVSARLKSLTPEISTTTEQLKDSANTSSKKRTAIVRSLASSMHQYAKWLRGSNAQYRQALARISESLRALFSGEFKVEKNALPQLRSLIAVMQDVEQHAQGGRANIAGLAAVIEALPRIEKEFNRAKRSVAEELKDLVSNIDQTVAALASGRNAATLLLGNGEI